MAHAGFTGQAFRQCKRIWRETKHPYDAVVRFLREQYAPPHLMLAERMLLFGARVEDAPQEELIGTLSALAPGIVCLNAHEALHHILSGLIVRSPARRAHRYMLQPFVPRESRGSLYIYDASWPTFFAPSFNRCPVYILWGMREAQEPNQRLGIEPERWHRMEEWLARWLPADECARVTA